MHAAASHKIKTLQLLRAVAVLLVIYAHIIDGQPGSPLQAQFFSLGNFGAVGVDIFFVISGFIITIISRPYANLRQPVIFLKKRLIRVIPPYWIVSAGLIIYSWLTTHYLPQKAAIAKTIFFFPFFDKTYFAIPVLYVGWTLSFELLFYVVVAICLWLAPKRYIALIILFFIGCIVLQYMFHSSLMLVFVGNPIILEFLLGILAGILYLHPAHLPTGLLWAMMMTGIVGLIATIFTGYYDISEALPAIKGESSLLRAILWGIPSALLVAGATLLEKKEKLSAGRLWVNIGDASYSLYLTHMPALAIIYAAWNGAGVINLVPPDLFIFITLVLCAMAGYLFYRLVEKPMHAWLQRKL
jgi:exopolysaccharide production protein ExoZ